MAKFLVTTGLSYHLEQLVKEAKERVILISPFLQVNERLRELLEDRNRLKLDVRIIYGKSELQPDESNWLSKLSFVRTSFCKNLHAKCYLNEGEALVTSMNLYEYSQVNNNEMGVYVSRADDPELYKSIFEEAQRLLRISDEVQISVEKVDRKQEAAQGQQVPRVTKAPVSTRKAGSFDGHCIVCAGALSLNPARPFCRNDYKGWSGDENEKQAFCHGCGTQAKVTFAKPLCRPCYDSMDVEIPF